MLLQLGLDDLVLFVEEALIALWGELVVQAEHVLLLIATFEVEHFGGVLVEQDAPVHLIHRHLLLLYLLPSDREVVLLLEDGEV